MALSRDGRFQATGSHVGASAIWSLPGPRLIGALEGNAVSVKALEFSPDSSRLAVGLLDGTVKVHDVRTAVETLTLPHKHSQGIEALAFIPDGTELISVSADALCVWRAPQLRDLDDTIARLQAVRRAPGR